jgi:calcineurin-like phosphoesterase family protein
VATFLNSDTHSGDHGALNLYPRPFGNVAEMDAGLAKRCNAASGPEVWRLGDFARTAVIAASFVPRLHGRKHLVVGNNDPAPQPAGWTSVAPCVEIEREGVGLGLCHCPFRSWNGQHRGAWNLHGHSHGRLKPLARQADVRVDANDYSPVRLDALLGRSARPNRPAPGPT